MQNAPRVVVEADDNQTIQREFGQGEIVDQFRSKDYSVFLVQSPKLPTLPNTVLQGPIYGVGIFREERRARTLAQACRPDLGLGAGRDSRPRPFAHRI